MNIEKTIDQQFAPNANRKKKIRMYPKWMAGPYKVFFGQKETPIKVIHIADSLQKVYKSVGEIKKCSNFKVQITFSDRAEANKLVTDPEYTKLYKVFISGQQVEISGIINESGIDLHDLRNRATGKFKQPGICNLPILECSQIARFSPEENKFVPSNGIRVTFHGNILPDYVEYKKVLFPLRPFYPKVMFCRICQKYGHTFKFCHSKDKSTKENSCPKCETIHFRIEDCPIYKAKVLKSRTQYKIKCRKNSLNVESHLDSSTISFSPVTSVNNVNTHVPASSTEPKTTTSQPLTTVKPDSTGGIGPLISITTLIMTICDTMNVAPDWRVLIATIMPVLQQIWNQIIIQYPLLGLFISS